MNNVYQNQRGALPLSSFAPYLTNAAYALWQEGMGNAVSNFVQSTENRLSQWFWDGIGSLPKNYFSKDTTNANCFDKSLREGIFNAQIEGLQEQLLSEALKEPASDKTNHTALIEQVRSSFRSKLKTEQGLLEECLQGDLLHLFKKTPEKSLTPAPPNKALRYYKPLMQHKTYAKQKEWIEQCYHTQSLLPLPSARKHVTKSSPIGVLTRFEGKQDSPTWGRGIRNWGKLLWENSGKLITLGLATQAAAVQASNNRTQGELVSEGNLTDGLMLQNTSFEEKTTIGGYKIDDKIVVLPIHATDVSNLDPYCLIK